MKLLEKIKLLIVKLFRPKEVFYVNSVETLPPPLDPETEAEIIAQMESNPEKASI